jgi:hypothetical protein
MPIVLKDMVLNIGTDVAAEVSSATLQPNPTIVKWKGLKPGSQFTGAGDHDYDLVLEVAQDWQDAGSLSNYLWDNDGETIADCVLEPQSGVGVRWTFDLFIIPGAVGGAVDTVGTSQVTLGIIGKPVKSDIGV